MNLILTLFFILFVFLIGIIPFFMIYGFSDIVYLLLFYVFGYRKKVVYKNLSSSFPDVDKRKLMHLVRKSYRNLTDVIVEGFKGFIMSNNQIIKRHKILNPEIIEPFRNANRSIITVPSHYGNWEWGALSPGLFFSDYQIVGFYKPLSNKYIDRFLKNNRSRTGALITSIYKTSDIFENLKDVRSIYIMAADQSPSNASKAYWVDFLGKETAFLHGPENYARKYNLPVVFVDIQRVKRGFYELTLSILSDDSASLDQGEIIKRYANALENVIRNKPENWLWSHRRWKLNREN